MEHLLLSAEPVAFWVPGKTKIAIHTRAVCVLQELKAWVQILPQSQTYWVSLGKELSLTQLLLPHL